MSRAIDALAGARRAWVSTGAVVSLGYAAAEHVPQIVDEAREAADIVARLLEFAESRIPEDEPWPDCVTDARAFLAEVRS